MVAALVANHTVTGALDRHATDLLASDADSDRHRLTRAAGGGRRRDLRDRRGLRTCLDLTRLNAAGCGAHVVGGGAVVTAVGLVVTIAAHLLLPLLFVY